nr:5-oxoprolinase subunit PxpA [Allomuricauda sp.]
MNQLRIDINCDVGEGIGNEAELFPLIGSCNIACGGHAGDAKSILEMIHLAKLHKVKIGAHPSYPDRKNFGRQVMDISKEELRQSLKLQLQSFISILKKENVTLHHIKPHGALYNKIAQDENLALLVLSLFEELDVVKRIYAPFGSVVAKMAPKNGVEVVFEAFGDRNYNKDGSLVSRQKENAVIRDPKAVLNHVLPMVKSGKVMTVEGIEIKISADTICIHGDTPNALEILTYLTNELPKHDVLLSK